MIERRRRVDSVHQRRPLRFGAGNCKLPQCVTTFSLPAGHTCPGADQCLSKTNRKTGKLKDGPNTVYRCYAASMECHRPSVRESRWVNFELLKAAKTRKAMAQLILDSLSPFAGYVRIHDSGDFFKADYFGAWLDVANERPDTTFYCYTKAIHFWVRHLEAAGTGRAPGLVPNFVPTASIGGKYDSLIEEHKLRTARVVLSGAQAEDLGLEIDHDDSHARSTGPTSPCLSTACSPAGATRPRPSPPSARMGGRVTATAPGGRSRS